LTAVSIPFKEVCALNRGTGGGPISEDAAGRASRATPLFPTPPLPSRSVVRRGASMPPPAAPAYPPIPPRTDEIAQRELRFSIGFRVRGLRFRV
jgi:hypothetical protein